MPSRKKKFQVGDEVLATTTLGTYPGKVTKADHIARKGTLRGTCVVLVKFDAERDWGPTPVPVSQVSRV